MNKKIAVFAPVFLFMSSFVYSEASLSERVHYLEGRIQSQNKLQADLNYKMNEMQQQIRELTGIIEEQTFNLKRIKERQRTLYHDIEYRLSTLLKNKKIPKNSIELLSQNVSSKNNKNSERRKSFEKAFLLVKSKQYSASIVAFQSFLKKHPKSDYSANARYWLGQVFLLENALEPAIKQLKTLIKDFPQSEKKPNALLKLGDIYTRQKKWDLATKSYNEVATHYTGAKQQLARRGLKKIKALGH
jgi:tol-pal system protein YbgF